MAMSHRNCTHPATPAGRRACRAGNTTPPAPTPPPIGQPYVYWPDGMSHAEYRALVRRKGLEYEASLNTAPVRAAKRVKAAESARQSRAAGRSRRGGARVAPGTSACVQAALHVDEHGGKCACGWKAVAA